MGESQVINAAEYYLNEIKPKRLIDIEIAKIMGLNVVGWADCSDAYEGIIVAEGEREWIPTAMLDPVYVDGCVCERWDKMDKQMSFRAFPKFLGHYGACLGEVPSYTREMDAAMMVVDKLNCSISISRTKDSKNWYVALTDGAKAKKFLGESLPMAICKCALLFLEPEVL